MFTYIANLFGFGGNDDGNETLFSGAEALVTEYNEISDNPAVDDVVEATVDSIDRISKDGVFHTYSVAKVDFDLGHWGTYPVELAMPRFPEEESEVEAFMDRLGLEVADLPRLEEGNFTVPFVRVDGEWEIDWENVETQEEE